MRFAKVRRGSRRSARFAKSSRRFAEVRWLVFAKVHCGSRRFGDGSPMVLRGFRAMVRKGSPRFAKLRWGSLRFAEVCCGLLKFAEAR